MLVKVVYFVPTVLQTNVGLTRNLSLILGGRIRKYRHGVLFLPRQTANLL